MSAPAAEKSNTIHFGLAETHIRHFFSCVDLVLLFCGGFSFLFFRYRNFILLSVRVVFKRHSGIFDIVGDTSAK